MLSLAPAALRLYGAVCNGMILILAWNNLKGNMKALLFHGCNYASRTDVNKSLMLEESVRLTMP